MEETEERIKDNSNLWGWLEAVMTFHGNPTILLLKVYTEEASQEDKNKLPKIKIKLLAASGEIDNLGMAYNANLSEKINFNNYMG